MHNQDTYIDFIDPKYGRKVCLGARLEFQKKRRHPRAPTRAHPPLDPASRSLHECNDAK